MVGRKEIIVLSGGGHKGIVKVSGVAGKDKTVKVSCSLDFRPNNAKLYLIGDNIAQMTLNNTNCEEEVAFSAKDDLGCVLRSSSVTMFGGGGSKSEMLRRIEETKLGHDTRRNDKVKEAEVKTASAEQPIDIPEALSNDAADVEKKESYVGVSLKSDVNPLGEWTKYDGNNFYYAVKPQIDEMFICYPEEGLLASTVPNSKWVRVDAEDGYYVVGLLYDDDEPSFICYGVPQHKTDGEVKAPKELENMCVWLPVGDNEELMGYWIIYQSARTGEIIK